MDRKTVAQTLGVSEKTVSRYVASGRLPANYVRGVMDVSNEDVQRLKTELATPVKATGHTETRQSETSLVLVPKGKVSNPSNALQVLDRVTGRAETGRDKRAVPIPDMLTLSLEEAAALSGFSSQRLRAAITDGTLNARKVGRGWKMRRRDLETFVDTIFGDE